MKTRAIVTMSLQYTGFLLKSLSRLRRSPDAQVGEAQKAKSKWKLCQIPAQLHLGAPPQNQLSSGTAPAPLGRTE